LENAFRPFGDIRNARILLDPATQMGTGVGFLLYAQKHQAEKASEVMFLERPFAIAKFLEKKSTAKFIY